MTHAGVGVGPSCGKNGDIWKWIGRYEVRAEGGGPKTRSCTYALLRNVFTWSYTIINLKRRCLTTHIHKFVYKLSKWNEAFSWQVYKNECALKNWHAPRLLMGRSFLALCGICPYMIVHFGSLSHSFIPVDPSVAQDDFSILQYKKNIYMGVYMLLKNLVGVNIRVYARVYTRLYIPYIRMPTYMCMPAIRGTTL